MQDLAFHSYKREQRLTLKAGWSVLKKLPFFTWERMCPPPHFFLEILIAERVSLLKHAFVTAVHAGGTIGNLEWKTNSEEEKRLTKSIHYTQLLPATCTFILLITREFCLLQTCCRIILYEAWSVPPWPLRTTRIWGDHWIRHLSKLDCLMLHWIARM